MALNNPLLTKTQDIGTLENSIDPEEMPQEVAFHQGQHCLHRKKEIYGERNKK